MATGAARPAKILPAMASRMLLLTLASSLFYVQVTLASNFSSKYLNTEISMEKYCEASGCNVICCPGEHIKFSKDKYYCVNTGQLVKTCDIVKSSLSKLTDVKTRKKYVKSIQKRCFPFNFLESEHVSNDPGETKTEQPRLCIELEIKLSDNGNFTTILNVRSDEGDTDERLETILVSSGMLVSCFFLLLALVVYALLPELRNLAGMMLMACMATYFAFFLTRTIHVLAAMNETIGAKSCLALTLIFYYLMMSSYCWMNVMSFDIFWTFRVMRKSVQIQRCGVMSKFRRYCAYAWGLPVLPTLFIVVVDQLDLSHLPNFVQPHLPTEESGTCYFEQEEFVWYVCVPAAVVVCSNVVLFAMTSYHIWQVKRNVTRYSLKDRQLKKKNEYRFWVYLRLSLVMGVSWVVEVISNVIKIESPLWYIADCYNTLIGLFIFLLFVCKKKIFLRLCARFSIENRLVRWVRGGADATGVGARTGHADSSDADAHLTSSDATLKCISNA